MTPDKIPHLCGGILFGLLCEAKKTRRKAKDKLNGGSDGLTIPGIYAGLIHIVTGDDLSTYAGTTLKKCATNYRKCENSTGEYVPFTNPAVQSAFDAQYKKKDPDLLKRMSRFIDTYLNEAKCEWLVRALIETMQTEQLDTDIAISYTKALRVSDLYTSKEISFLPFLLSVLHYVIMECPDCESGRPTFESWYSQRGSNTAWKFNSNIGNGLEPMDVSVDLTLPTITESKSSVPNNDVDIKSDHEVIVENMTKGLQPLLDTIEVQKKVMPKPDQMFEALNVIKDACESTVHETAEKIRNRQKHADTKDAPEETSTNGTVVHQTIVNQYGDHPVHIDHVENLKL